MPCLGLEGPVEYMERGRVQPSRAGGGGFRLYQ